MESRIIFNSFPRPSELNAVRLCLATTDHNRGNPMCEPNIDFHTTDYYETNYIVAIPRSLIAKNKSSYCGKMVRVYHKGRLIPRVFVAWDGCVACDENGGIDFSSSAFAEIFGAERCKEGRISGEVSWEIIDRIVYDPVGRLLGPVPGTVI